MILRLRFDEGRFNEDGLSGVAGEQGKRLEYDPDLEGRRIVEEVRSC